MKNKLLIIVLLIAGGCNKFKDDINRNPNLPNVASGTQLIANAELYLPNVSSNPVGEFHAQYLARLNSASQLKFFNFSGVAVSVSSIPLF